MNKTKLAVMTVIGLVIGSTRTTSAADLGALEIRGDLLRMYLNYIETARQQAIISRQAEIEFWAKAGKYPGPIFVPEDIKKRAAESKEKARYFHDSLRLLIPRPQPPSP